MGSMAETPVKNPWIETPLIESITLSRAAGCRIFLKLENFQPSASFKSRGIGNLIRTQIAHHKAIGSSRPLHFFSSSGGNAGIAAVTAAASLGYKCSVAVPTSTEEMMIAKIKAGGASDVIRFGDNWAAADHNLREKIMPRAAEGGEEPIYVPPFDHAAIWDGVSSMVEEVERQMPEGETPDAIACSVGGGGLFCGIMQGLERAGWNDVKVLAVETDGADSLSQALKQGELVTLPGITSVAKSLGASRVARQAFEYAQRKNVSSVVLDDAEACMACCRFAVDERIIVEPACGASVALCYDGKLGRLVPGLNPDSKVVIVVCGGNGVTLDLLMKWREQYGEKVKEMESGTGTMNEEEVPSTFTEP